MDLTDADLYRLERKLDDLVKPTIGELRAMLTEIRASRAAIRTLNQFVADAAKTHTDLGNALQRAGEVR